jgi:hypothetical protein
MAKAMSGTHLTVLVLDWRDAQLLESVFLSYLSAKPVDDEDLGRHWAVDKLYKEFIA